MGAVPELTQDRLKELLLYDTETGLFRHAGPRRGVRAGSVAGTANTNGHIQIRVDGKLHLAHRLAFLYMTGEWPPDYVDHRDLDKANNRWVNIRAATGTQNQANKRGCGAIPLKGVCMFRGRYLARIQISGKKKYLGSFETPEEAHAAYARAANDNFGEFARTA